MDIPFPAPADPKKSARSDDLRRSVELGQKRAQAESALRQKIREGKEAEDQRAHASAEMTAQDTLRAKKKAKGFRLTLKTREKDYVDFEARKATEKQWYEKQNEQMKEHRRKEKAYMASLNASSAEIIAERRRVEALKADEIRAEQKIEFEHASSVQEANRIERQTMEHLTSDARQKIASIEEKARQELYTLDSWKRAQLSALDAENHRLSASLQYLSPLDASRELQRVTVQMRTRKRTIEKEFSDKRSALELGLQREKTAIDRDRHEASFQTGLDARRQVAKADRTRDTRLEETRHEFDKRIRDRSGGAKKK